MLKFFQTIIKKIKAIIIKPENLSSNILSRLMELSGSLESDMVGVEKDFLSLGQKFQAIFSETEELKSLVLSTAKLSGNETDSVGILGVGEFARRAVQILASCQNDIAENLKILESGGGHLQSLSNMCANTDKVALLLNVIALNISIESNRSEESRDMFMVFVKEVKELSEKISHVSHALYDDSESTRKKQIQHQKKISGDLKQLKDLTGKAESVVKQAVEEIEGLVEKSLQSLERAAGCSNDISRLVSSIVIALQFHDIVRQQIEHVVMALNDIAALCPDDALGGLGSTGVEKKMAKAYYGVKLQSAQIKEAVYEIDSAYRKVLHAFEGIEKGVIELVSCVSFSTTEKAKAGGGENDSFSIVLSSLKDLDSLISEAQILNSSMEQAAGDASGSAAGLLKHVDLVQSISLDLHRKALNAIIKAAHLGDMGCALEVFAQEVTTTSNASNIFAQKVATHINAISELSEKMSGDAKKTTGESPDYPENKGMSLTRGIECISDSCDQFLETASNALNQSRRLETSISEAKSALAFMADFSKKMKSQLSRSEEILQDLSPYDISDTHDADIDVLQRYTMESERRVHSMVFGASPGMKPEQLTVMEPPANRVGDTDDNGDLNIDLFDEVHSGPDIELASEDMEKQNDQQLPDGVDSEGKEDDDEEFDENIELF